MFRGQSRGTRYLPWCFSESGVYILMTVLQGDLEMQDRSSRPEIAAKLDNTDDYDVILLGFPIWWYVAPTIINTFL